jgi:hypothetical protein
MARGLNTCNIHSASPGNTATANLSIAGWYFTSLAVDATFIGNGNQSNNGYAVECNAAGNAGKCVIKNFSGGGDANGTVVLAANTWYHVCATKGASAWNLYFNGVADTLSGATTFVTTAPTSFSYVTTSGATQNVRFADFSLWNVELTPAEVLALAKGARPNTIRPANLSLWWPLDGLQSPEPDLSGGGRNGTLSTPANGSIQPGPPVAPFTPRWPQFSEPPPPPTSVLFAQASL